MPRRFVLTLNAPCRRRALLWVVGVVLALGWGPWAALALAGGHGAGTAAVSAAGAGELHRAAAGNLHMAGADCCGGSECADQVSAAVHASGCDAAACASLCAALPVQMAPTAAITAPPAHVAPFRVPARGRAVAPDLRPPIA